MKHTFFLWGQSLIDRGAWFFAPLSWFWALFSSVKNLFYDFKWISSVKLSRAVVSVGNLVVGGTGKTPFVHFLAKTFAHRKVAILSRGYGSFADEAALLARRLPDVKVYVGKDRIASGRKAIQEGAELILLDDGFQHRKLFRDLDLVLLDSEDPFGKGHYLPWGYLRDSPKRLKQADAVFFNGRDLFLRVKQIFDLRGNSISSLKQAKIALFSGIAKPAKFKKTVEDLGAQVISEWILADHAPIPLFQLNSFAKSAQQLGASALVCTEKDVVKLSPTLELPLPLFFLEMEMEIAENHKNWEKLVAKIEQTIDNYSSI